MKKITFFLSGIIIFFSAQQLNSQTFDWESATDNGTNVTQIVSGITATVTTSNNDAQSVNGGGFDNSSGVVVFTQNSDTSTFLKISFSSAVNVLSIFTFLADNDSGGETSLLFTPTGGSNATVTEGIAQSSGEVVVLNWTGVTEITLTVNGGGTESFGIDDIVLGVANTAPTDISLNPTSINQSTTGTNAFVGTLSTTDADTGDSHTYSLVSGTGDANNDSFNINGTSLRTNGALTPGTYNVRINTFDGTDNFAKQFTITVVDNVAPAPPSTPDLATTSDTGNESTTTGATSDNLTNDLTPTFSGTAEANATVTIISSVEGTLGTTTANGSGNWSFTPSGNLSMGSFNITATATDAANNTSSSSSALSISIDATQPTITLSSVEASVTNGDINGEIPVTFTFNEEVDGFKANDITFGGTANTNLVALSFQSADSTTFTAKFKPTNDGSLFIQVNSAVATDLAGNNNTAATQLNFTFDSTDPIINAVSLAANNSYIDVTFSESVYDTSSSFGALEASDFNLSLSGGTATSPSVTSVTAIGGGALTGGETTVRVNFSVTGTINGAETLEVDLGSNAVYDAAGNISNANQTSNNTVSLNDVIAPTITSVSLPADATYLAGQNLDFTVNFNEDITVVTTGGTPQISLTIGSTLYQASYISGSGSSALIFRYTVQNGDNDTDGIAIGTLALNGGTLKDVAGNDANLTLNSVGSTSGVLVDTPLNNALNFDGANDQVDLGNNLNSTLDNLNTFTVEAWVKPETNTGLGVIVGNYHNGVGNMQFLLRRDNANYTFWVDDGTGFKNVTATGAVNIGTWTQIAGVWDGSQIRIYVNGVLSGTTTGITGASFITTANPIRIGFNNVNENFDGDIDEVRIWSDVRNVTEINNLKSTELNGAEDNLLGYYNFNKGIPNGTNTGETTLLDLSTNNNHGTVSNFDLSGTSSNWVVGTPIETIPVVQSVAVPSNATYISGQNLDFTVNYSEDVTVSEIGGTPQIAITIGANTRQAEFESGSGTSALVFRYTVQPGDEDSDGITIASLSANGGTLQDSNNNNANVKLNSIGTTTSILIDAAAPTLSSTNPTDNATDVLLTQNIELTFSENISKGSGNITIFKTSDDSVVETIDVTSGLVSITTTTATINPTDDFELNTEYYVQIAAGVFTDTALNAYTGISDKTSLSFTSQANQTNTYSGSGNWSTTANWSLGRLPIASDNVVINFGSTVLFDVASATINNLNISSGTLNMVAGNALTLDGDLSQTGTFNIASSASANASLIVKGTSTGNVSYLRHVSTNWHLIGAPVEGQSISALSGQVNTSDTKYAIAPYKNNTTTLLRWNYYTTAAGTNDIANSGNFISGKGYTIQKSSFAGTISFTGTLNTDNAGESIAITDGGDDPTGNRWNLIANPYTAAINGNNTADATNNFLKVNIDAGNLDPSRAGLYLWTGSAPYDIKSLDDGALYIAPGQAFFVHAPDGGGTSASFTEAMQTHQTGNIFSKGSSSNYPEIILNLTDGKANSLTKVRYIQNKTTGLDVGSDVGTFTGASSNFGIFSHLLQDSQGVDFAIQALPNSNYENMIVPIGINAEAGKEISFSANIANFPSGVKVFLEDRAHNRFFSLDDEGSKYKITVNNAQNGIGRFYLHTTSSALNVDKSLTLENINVYKLNNSTLRITGLSQERTEVTIFNILGKKVLNTTLKANTLKDIDLPHLSNGIYLVQLKNNSGKLTKKILLE